MATRFGVVVAAAVVGLMGGVRAEAQPTMAASVNFRPVTREMGISNVGSISSLVHDAKGSPVEGAIVSAVGGRTATATTDTSGHCALVSLPAGDYLVRVHRTGFAVANSLVLRVTPGHITAHSVVLTPIAIDRPVATKGESPGIMTAGFLPAGTTGLDPSTDPEKDDDIDQSEVAWRLRHVRRSVLKDAVDQVHLAEDGNYEDGVGAFFGRAMTAPVRAAAALFNEAPPLTGQVNLLTTSTFDSTDKILSDLSLARGVAYLSLGAGAGTRGDWSARAALTQGDLSSWMLAGSFISRAPTRHRYEAGMTLAAQRYSGTNAASLAAVSDGTRNAGAVYAFDSWTIARTVSVIYGARYASYGYIEKALFSPRLQVNLQPSRGMRVMMSASRRSEAPGAEEFVPSTASNEWLPPQRTFAPLVGTQFTPERTDTYQFAVEHDLSKNSIVAVRTFVQHTDDQVATLFGLGSPSVAPLNLDHYYVASAGDFTARGWAVSVTHVVAGHLRGTVDYAVTTAHWRPGAQSPTLGLTAPSVVRPDSEQLHDLTTSLETDIPVTATRVFAMYRINNAYAGTTAATEPGFAARFDVQITQALPFMNFSNAQWEALVGVRNLFREVAIDGSIYDELLVVGPPKRVVGGVTVRF